MIINYTPTAWVNEVPNGLPLRYRITLADGTVVAEGATIELLNMVTMGTPVNATNLNKMEGGIKNAQDSANAATRAAEAAQGKANQAYTTATSAQAAANAAGTAAANAQTTAANAQTSANSAIPKSVVQAKGDLLVATGAGVISRLPAGTNGQVVVYDSTQALGVRAGTVAPDLSLASLASDVSSTSQTWADALTAAVTLDRAGRIRVRAYGQFRGSALYVAPSVRLVIDGVADTFIQSYQLNTDPADQSWRPWAAEWFRAGVAAGARQVKLQFRNNYAGGTAYLAAGARLVIVVDYP